MKQLKAGTAILLMVGDKARGGFWRWVASMFVICSAYTVISVALAAVFWGELGKEASLIVPGDAFQYDRSDFLTSTVLMFGFIAALIPAIALSLLVHKLRLSDIVAPIGRVRWMVIGKSALWTFGFMLLGTFVAYWTHGVPEDFYFDPLPATLWHFIPVIIVMIALQASAEELLFRGYILQMIGRLTKSWWIILIVVGGLFFALHLFNPDVEVFGWFAYLSYALSALLFTGLALATGRLEYAIGVHIGWNWSVTIADIDPLQVPELYTGFGAIVYTGPLEATLSDAIAHILLHLIIALWCLTDHIKRENSLST